MKALVYDGIQKVECRKVDDPKIEEYDETGAYIKEIIISIIKKFI